MPSRHRDQDMETCVNRVQRYRAKAARRPVLFWWQAFFLFGLVILLWSQLPATSVLYESRIFSPLPDSRASYVTLDSAYAAQAFKKLRISWTLGAVGKRSAAEMELGSIDMTETLQPPSFLEQGAIYPGVWQPAVVQPLPQRLPAVGVSSVPETPTKVKWPEPPQGIRPAIGRALSSAAFAFTLPKEPLPEHRGYCRFYLETDTDGSVAHLLLLSPRTGAATIFEQALIRGRAKTAARGFAEFAWSFSK